LTCTDAHLLEGHSGLDLPLIGALRTVLFVARERRDARPEGRAAGPEAANLLSQSEITECPLMRPRKLRRTRG